MGFISYCTPGSPSWADDSLQSGRESAAQAAVQKSWVNKLHIRLSIKITFTSGPRAAVKLNSNDRPTQKRHFCSRRSSQTSCASCRTSFNYLEEASMHCEINSAQQQQRPEPTILAQGQNEKTEQQTEKKKRLLPPASHQLLPRRRNFNRFVTYVTRTGSMNTKQL